MRGGLAALSAVALAACAAGGPLDGDRQPGAPPGRTLPGADGTALAAAHWPAGSGAPRAVILGVHGFGDHARSTFARAARAWSEAGIATWAYDQRGFGRNPSRGRWPGAEALVADLAAVARHLRRRHPCTPLVVVGHSMGGGVALAAAPRLPAEGLVLAAPAIWGGDALNPLHRLAAWTGAAIAPDRRLSGEGVVEIRPTDNARALRRLARDPLYLSPPNARELMGLVRVMDRAAAAASHAAMPALLLLGARDEIVPASRAEAVFAQLSGPRSVIRYAEGWHLLFRDRQAARVWRDVAEWTGERSPPQGCVAGADRWAPAPRAP